jgi:hypothetical protein
MLKLLRFIGKLLGAILVPVFILISFTSILLLSFDSQLFNQDFYLKVFSSEDFFDRLPEVAAVQIQYAIGSNPCLENPDLCDDEGDQITSSSGGPPSYFQALSQNDWELLLRGILPPEWLEDKLMEVTGNLIQSVDTGKGDIAVAFSLADLKERLGGPDGVDAIVQVLDAQPECSKDDLLMMTRILEGKEDPGADFLSCRPTDDFIENYSPQIEVLLRRSLRDIPDEIELGKGLIPGDNAIKAFGYQVPTYLLVQWIRWSIRMSPLFCVSLLLVIAILAVHSYKGLGGWWGYPLAITGLIGLALALLISPLASWLSSILLKGRAAAGISPVLIETGSSLAVRILRTLFNQVRNYSLIAIGMGLAVIIIASVLSPGGKKPAADDQEAAPPEDLEKVQEIDQQEIPDPREGDTPQNQTEESKQEGDQE